jgi:hypothetical protein
MAPRPVRAQPFGCRAALTMLPYRGRRSWIDRLTCPLDTADDARAPNLSASSFAVANGAAKMTGHKTTQIVERLRALRIAKGIIY